MKKYKFYLFLIITVFFLFNNSTVAQNPIILDQFTADPSARIFNGRVYVYPSHDILSNESRGRIGWFCMEDYHLFSSSNLTDWTDHGVIVSQNKVDWIDSSSYSMWAPDCIAKNGKYYFYFPSNPKDTIFGRGFSIGVAVSDKPDGPFVPQPEPIKGVKGIDPNPFIDKDGQAYIYWSMGKIYVAKLEDNMLELASEPQVVEDLPEAGLKEGPYMFERNGIYYMTYPHVQNKTERLEYAIGDNPMGPFKVTGVIMDESPTGCWTNHQSIIQYEDQWYLFYHHNDLSPKFDKNRSIRIDSLFFNDDGTIQKVTPTLRGVGVTGASQKIELDRYSYKSETGVSIAFLDTLNTFKGWKSILEQKDAWIRYNAVDFGNETYRSVQVKVLSQTGGTLQIRLDKPDGPLLSEVKIPEGTGWKTVDSSVSKIQPGIHNLVVVLKDDNPVEIDWIRFLN
ncbi:MAG: alpha-N-arabinofuranosidase [Bacteroides sp. SM23_62_1]|nr:MAG: alpha-N-arabinofuranosidase [Bacteroides sp. SM23_62_1]